MCCNCNNNDKMLNNPSEACCGTTCSNFVNQHNQCGSSIAKNCLAKECNSYSCTNNSEDLIEQELEEELEELSDLIENAKTAISQIQDMVEEVEEALDDIKEAIGHTEEDLDRVHEIIENLR